MMKKNNIYLTTLLKWLFSVRVIFPGKDTVDKLKLAWRTNLPSKLVAKIPRTESPQL